jgi:hypothetical protein
MLSGRRHVMTVRHRVARAMLVGLVIAGARWWHLDAPQRATLAAAVAWLTA